MRSAFKKARTLRPSASIQPISVGYDMTHPLVCEVHQEHGPIMACPFPDCEFGLVAEDEWVKASPPALDAQVYRRLRWETGANRPTWSWDSDRSGFLALLRVFWSEVRRRGLAPSMPATRRAFHYTSLQGFLGMIGTHELWLSDYAYLNDVAELAHGAARARDIYAEVANARPTSRTMLQAQGNPDLSRHRVCVASFSMDPDSLGQWRAYGPIAIGFELSYMNFGYANTVQLGPVVYDPKAQDEMLRLFAHLNASAWERESQRERRRLRGLYTDSPDRLLDLVAFFKNHGFSDEREIRMVHTESPRMAERLPHALAPERFRASNGLIVPYVTTRDLHEKHPERLPIREVVIGPGPKAGTLMSGVKRALAAGGYDVPVRVSGVTYRQ